MNKPNVARSERSPLQRRITELLREARSHSAGKRDAEQEALHIIYKALLPNRHTRQTVSRYVERRLSKLESDEFSARLRQVSEKRNSDLDLEEPCEPEGWIQW